MKTTTAIDVFSLRILFLALLLSACTGASTSSPTPPKPLTVVRTAYPSVLTVFAAASLAEPFEEIGQAFESRPENMGVAVEFSFAGSQQLARQINEGAPADVFAAANQEQMDAVIAEGNVDANAPRIFAENRLVVIVPEDNPAEINDLADLARPGLKLVLAAEEVPAGRYSLEFLRKASADPQFGADYEAKVLVNVVSYDENVRAVLTKVQLGEADAGIVYATDAAAGRDLRVIDIPLVLNVNARYPIAVVSGSPNEDVANRFVEFVLSPEAQDIISRSGFVKIKQ